MTHLLGTDYLAELSDPRELLLEGLNRFLDQALVTRRKERDKSFDQLPSQEELAAAVAEKRKELARYLGVVDSRLPVEALEYICSTGSPAKVAEGAGYGVYRVRWPVLEGVFGEGLYLKPQKAPIARAIALGDADWLPEDLVGLTKGLAPGAQFARHLAEMGCEVVVPILIDRDCTWSGNPAVRMTNQPHREFVYRMAYQMGRHIIGYEVQKILALVDWFFRESSEKPVVVFGYGEGGLLALHSAALDVRILGVGVSGYFGDRFRVWEEPIYRNVWRLLRGFTDAELAAMVAPRTLIVEASPAPVVTGPPAPAPSRQGAAPGRLRTPSTAEVQAELALARKAYGVYGATEKLVLVEPKADQGPGTSRALGQLLQSFGPVTAPKEEGPVTVLHPISPDENQEQRKRQFQQLCAYTHLLWQRSGQIRERFWARADATSVETWKETTEAYRTYFWEEVIGKCPPPTESLMPRSRRSEENPAYDVYEVSIDVWEGVPAFAYLLVPKGIKEGERRPVVVCQHGLGGDPAVLLRRGAYKALARTLAEEGFVTLAPQNPSIGAAGDRFRVLQRKANPLGWSVFSFIVGIHQQWLTFLRGLPFVDPARIGFYGLSYGGKTALRVPAILSGYALSICSGDFNEWIMKTVSPEFFSSYMFTGEYEVYEFNLGHTFNHGEMAYLIAPRPFMVERGTDDPCGSDEWVAFEYAKVRRLYLKLGIPERTHMEVFPGGHEICFQDAAQFLRTFLGD